MGKLIVIDGLDGSGKTTQHGLLLAALSAKNIPARGISFPDYESESSALVKMYLGGAFGNRPGDVNPYAASSFYAVDRFASFKQNWGEDYQNGKPILAARYTSSNLFHQTEKLPRHLWDEFIQWSVDYEYNKLEIPAPDLVVFLDMPSQVAQRLISGRYGQDESKRDIHEKDQDYLNRCREAALYVAKRLNYRVLSCASGETPRPVEDIHRELFTIIREVLQV